MIAIRRLLWIREVKYEEAGMGFSRLLMGEGVVLSIEIPSKASQVYMNID